MSEGDREPEFDETLEQCQLSLDTTRRVLLLDFTEPVSQFAFDIETAQGLCKALQKGIEMLLDS